MLSEGFFELLDEDVGFSVGRVRIQFCIDDDGLEQHANSLTPEMPAKRHLHSVHQELGDGVPPLGAGDEGRRRGVGVVGQPAMAAQFLVGRGQQLAGIPPRRGY